MMSACTWQKNFESSENRKSFQYRSLTWAMKMPNKWRENLLFGDSVDLVNSNSCNLLSKLSFLSPLVHSLDNHDLWLQYAFEWIFKDHTISQLPLLMASSTSSPIIATATPILFKCSTCSFMLAINGVTTTIINGILSCLHSNACFIWGKSWKISLFPKPVGEIAKTSILPTRWFKQFLCSSRLASTFGKSLSALFVASLNSGRDIESVITAISNFSLWSKTLHCWQKLSKSTNQRVYQDLVYRNALLLKILTSVPAPLSPVPLYFSSLSLLRTALHYLNAWNRLILITDGLSLRLFSLEVSTVPNVRNKILKQGHFWPFTPRQWVIFSLTSSFQLNLADNYQEKLEMFTYK